ncbi:16.9 kDa class I heat shock protein 1-like [Phragmites australis]|uniref:16.9 kDa class I heat shock protein 1-like n=1 Tax=Phragmites australis TaxID=29695 RepID=UPI002D7A153F|nr:16.9 kDa class I heat shock protein 1-like [Phragmites australis]
MACSKPQRSSAKGAQPAACDADIDPELEWLDRGACYIVRLNLPGFKKEDFKVHVSPGGRLMVRGQRPAGYVRLHKAFQLPQTANLDGVSGRFEGSVLSLTVPKVPVSGTQMVMARLAEAQAAAECSAALEEATGVKGQMVAVAIAGFALGVFVAHRLLTVTNS